MVQQLFGELSLTWSPFLSISSLAAIPLTCKTGNSASQSTLTSVPPLMQKKKKKKLVWADYFFFSGKSDEEAGMERRETLRKWRRDLGNFLEVTVRFCHLSLAADNSTDLWTECQNGHCRYSKLMEQFSYLTLPAGDLLAQQEEKAKALCSGEAAKRCKVAGRCGCSTGMVTVGGGCQPVHLSCPRTRMVIQRSRGSVKWQIGGRVRVMRHKHVIKVFCAEVWWLRPNKNRGFFSLSSFLACSLHSSLPIFLHFFILSFPPFFSFSLYIFIKYIH